MHIIYHDNTEHLFLCTSISYKMFHVCLHYIVDIQKSNGKSNMYDLTAKREIYYILRNTEIRISANPGANPNMSAYPSDSHLY